jgi:hypothetical protein
MSEEPVTQSPEPDAIRVRGVVRGVDGQDELLVIFSADLSDDDMRAFHDYVNRWQGTTPSQ